MAFVGSINTIVTQLRPCMACSIVAIIVRVAVEWGTTALSSKIFLPIYSVRHVPLDMIRIVFVTCAPEISALSAKDSVPGCHDARRGACVAFAKVALAHVVDKA